MIFRFLTVRFLFAVMLGFTLGNLALLNTANAAKPTVTPTILVFGDSLSAAYGIPREQGWVALLQQRLKDNNLPYEVANASVSGETTSGGLSRLANSLKQYQPSIVIIELGANDGLRGLPINQIKTNLQKMITACQQVNAKVLLLGMIIPPNYGPSYTREFKDAYAGLAKQYKTSLVPFFLDGVAGNPELIQEDGLHPTAQAQPQILDTIWKTLKPELSKPRLLKKTK
jgi:acyl-CoA thioesterase-1